MHIQGREFIFEDLNITVAYVFADSLTAECGELGDYVPRWLGDDYPFEDSFSDFESFTLREGGGVLIVAVTGLDDEEVEFLNNMVSQSTPDQIKLLICSRGEHYKAHLFDAVLTVGSNLIFSLADLALAIYAGSKIDAEGARSLRDFGAVIRQSKSGYLARYSEDQEDKNSIDPCDLFEAWPYQAEEGVCVLGLWTWLNPANCIWSAETKENFVTFEKMHLNGKCIAFSSSGSFKPEYSRYPAPDVMQIIMIPCEK